MSDDQSKRAPEAEGGTAPVSETDEKPAKAAKKTESKVPPEVAKAWRETEKARRETDKARSEMDKARSEMEKARSENDKARVAMNQARAEAAALQSALDKIRVIPPPAPKARIRLRHVLLVLSFLLFVCAPLAGAGWYLWTRASDQYASDLGFTVRREEAPSAVDILGGLSTLSGSASSSDTDVLYEYIQSQELVRAIDARLDLRSLYSGPFDTDPWFALDPEASIEELLDYWHEMVRIAYAPATGLIEIKVLAFHPEEARAVGQAIIEESSAMINRLSTIARTDAMRYAEEELGLAVEQLKAAREAVREYRTRTQIVDPSADIQMQMGLLNTMQQRLGDELIALDLLMETAQSGDPRISQAESRIAAIQARIAEEREKFGTGGLGPGGENYANLVAEFERLNVDMEFAEQKYASALANFDAAQAEAERQSRYLAPYLSPTLAETPEYPQRILLIGLAALFLTVGWGILTLIYYSLRDRR